MMMMKGGSSSSSSGFWEGEPEAKAILPDLDRVKLDQVVSRAVKFWPTEKTIENRFVSLYSEYGFGALVEALNTLETTPASKQPNFGYFMGILKNQKINGGSVGSSVAKIEDAKTNRPIPKYDMATPEQRAAFMAPRKKVTQ